MSMTRALLTSVLSVALLAPGAALAPAQADDPIDVIGQITDEAGVLSGNQIEVQQALDRFFDRTGLQLFVVYVPTFGDLTGEEWAAKTSEKSGLGRADVLLVVATKDRAYGYDTDNETFSNQDLESVDRTKILPALRNDDFAGAAIAAADGYGDIAEADGLPWGWFVLAGVLVLVAGGLIVRRVRSRFDHTHRVLDEHGNPVDPAVILTFDELDTTASRALVAIDDALKTSEQELGYAEAQFGTTSTRVFRTTLERGHELVREAFSLRQKLDDAIEEPDKERRAMASRIITICEQVDDELDAEVESFDRLRDLQARAPEVLDELAARADEVERRLPESRAVLEELSSASVAGNINQAERLIATARDQVTKGREELDDRSTAATHARAAEDAIAQAVTLLDAIDEAETLAEKAEKERVTLEDSLGRVTSIVKGVGEFIETRRGAVGAQARTRLSEAARHLEQARRAIATDQAAAGVALAEAEEQAVEAQHLADADVAEWNEQQDKDDHDDRSPGFDSMLLGGILIDAIGRGRLGSVLGGSSHGGGSGTPYGGPSHRGSPRTPGSFGGTSTRGRRGGGGRF